VQWLKVVFKNGDVFAILPSFPRRFRTLTGKPVPEKIWQATNCEMKIFNGRKLDTNTDLSHLLGSFNAINRKQETFS